MIASRSGIGAGFGEIERAVLMRLSGAAAFDALQYLNARLLLHPIHYYFWRGATSLLNDRMRYGQDSCISWYLEPAWDL